LQGRSFRVLFFAFGIFISSCGYGIDVPVKLKQHVYQLSHTKKPRSVNFQSGLDEASAYIRGSLDSIGQGWRKQEYRVDSLRVHNIIAFYGDTTLPRLVIGAHYDVCMNLPGADDNASGVAGLLELSRRLNIEKPRLKHCIEMVFYTLEEPPHFRTVNMGSYVHAKDLADRKVNVEAMVCLEMIGFYSDEKGSQQYPANIMKLWYPNRGNFIAVVGKKGMKDLGSVFKKGINKYSNLPCEMLIAPSRVEGVDFSDHLNYWLFGFKAIMLTDSAFMRNKNYHKRTDTWDTLDYEKMAELVEGLFRTLKTYY